MANKAVVSIDVDDAAFQKFIGAYNGYRESLDEMPSAWDAINEAMGDAGKEKLALSAAQAGLIADHLRDAHKAQLAFSRATTSHSKDFVALGRAGSSAWKAIGGAADASISKVGSGIAGMAETALSALGPVGLAAGAIAAVVGGAGAALKGLADAGVSRQRSAFSKGITPGQEASFGVYGQQFMGSGALQAAANAQLNLGNAGPLSLLGIDFDKARRSTASDLAYQMLRGAVKGAQASPDMPLLNVPAIQAYLALGGDVGDVRNAMKMGLSALDASQNEQSRNAGRLNLKRGAVDQAATFKKAVEGAGVAAQSFGINNLSGADPVLAKILGAITGDKSAQASVVHAFQNVSSTIQQKVDPALHQFNTAVTQAAAAVKTAFLPNSVLHSLKSPLSGKAAAAVIAVAKKKGVDPTLALADAIQESGLDPSLHIMDHYSDGSPAGYSTGLFMLNEHGEGAGMSLKDMLDPTKNATVALAEFARVAKAHPNWSPGQIAAGAERPANPKQYAKDVDAIYASLVRAQRAARSSAPAVKVHVTNSTAANVAASINATAQF